MRVVHFLFLAASLLPGIEVSVKLPDQPQGRPLDGRLLILFSTDPSAEPRFQINDSPKTQVVFGVDVDGFRPGSIHSV